MFSTSGVRFLGLVYQRDLLPVFQQSWSAQMTPNKVEKPIWRALRITIRLSPRRRACPEPAIAVAVAERVSLFRHVPESNTNWRRTGSDPEFLRSSENRRLRPLPPNTGSKADPGPRFIASKESGSSSPLPAESSATALDVQLTEWTAYFASIACASHNWLSGQVTLPWFKSSDFAAAESSW